MQKTKSFFQMTPAERDAAVRQYDREIPLRETRPLSGKTKELWERSRRGRPKIGRGADKVLLSVEGGLLEKVDQFIQHRGITRSKLVVSLLDLAVRLAALSEDQRIRVKKQILAGGAKDSGFIAAVESVWMLLDKTSATAAKQPTRKQPHKNGRSARTAA